MTYSCTILALCCMLFAHAFAADNDPMQNEDVNLVLTAVKERTTVKKPCAPIQLSGPSYMLLDQSETALYRKVFSSNNVTAISALEEQYRKGTNGIKNLHAASTLRRKLVRLKKKQVHPQSIMNKNDHPKIVMNEIDHPFEQYLLTMPHYSLKSINKKKKRFIFPDVIITQEELNMDMDEDTDEDTIDNSDDLSSHYKCYTQAMISYKSAPSTEAEYRMMREDAEKGSANALNALGYAYFKGVPNALIVQDKKRAIGCFQRASELGLARSTLILAQCYAYGVGVLQNNDEARKLCLLAVQQGNQKVGIDALELCTLVEVNLLNLQCISNKYRYIPVFRP